MKKLKYENMIFKNFYVFSNNELYEDDTITEKNADKYINTNLHNYDAIDICICDDCLNRHTAYDNENIFIEEDSEFNYGCSIDGCDTSDIRLVRILIQEDDDIKLI